MSSGAECSAVKVDSWDAAYLQVGMGVGAVHTVMRSAQRL